MNRNLWILALTLLLWWSPAAQAEETLIGVGQPMNFTYTGDGVLWTAEQVDGFLLTWQAGNWPILGYQRVESGVQLSSYKIAHEMASIAWMFGDLDRYLEVGLGYGTVTFNCPECLSGAYSNGTAQSYFLKAGMDLGLVGLNLGYHQVESKIPGNRTEIPGYAGYYTEYQDLDSSGNFLSLGLVFSF